MSDLPLKGVCVEGALAPKLALVPASAAPQAIHKPNILDQPSKSGLFQQTEGRRRDANSPVVEELPLLFILTAILGN